MKPAILLCFATLTSCTFESEPGCLAIEQLAHRDAATDARAAVTRGYRRLLMLGGYTGLVPGVSEPYGSPTQMMDGTSDTTTEACYRQRPIAEAYASKYNQTIAQAD
jgi:hypothetical protein